jgi:hypothetical protein
MKQKEKEKICQKSSEKFVGRKRIYISSQDNAKPTKRREGAKEWKRFVKGQRVKGVAEQ